MVTVMGMVIGADLSVQRKLRDCDYYYRSMLVEWDPPGSFHPCPVSGCTIGWKEADHAASAAGYRISSLKAR